MSSSGAQNEPYVESLECSRFVLTDECPANAESWFLARCFAALLVRGVRGIVSFADPVPRTDDSGAVVAVGHVGTIYQATNAVYMGRATPRTVKLLPNGVVLNERMAQKVRRQEQGHEYAERLLIRQGAPALRVGVDPKVWLREALVAVGARNLRHRGVHRFCGQVVGVAARPMTLPGREGCGRWLPSEAPFPTDICSYTLRLLTTPGRSWPLLDQGQAFTVRSYRGAYDVRWISLKRALPTGLSASDRLVVDATVLAEHPEVGTLACTAPTLPVVAEEDLKSLEGALLVVTWLLDSGFDRGGTLYVIGGGTVQDTAAFAASIVHRGARWVFVPTTLLAQGDSCIGSKSSINHRGYKNQLGTFHPPAEVIVDDAFLGTLAPREVQSGIGEMLHYAALGGGTVWAAFEAELSGGWERLSTADMSALAMRATTVKKDFVEADEFDTGLRRNLNFGHTFGHGIEYASKGHIPHGIAVAYGIECANAYAEKLGILAPEVRARIGLIVRGLVDGSELREVSASQIVSGMAQDKKRVGDEAELILLEDLGRPVRVSARLDGHLERFLEHVLDTW